MVNIQNELNNIKSAIYGKDVRNSIHDAIKQCYDDASVNNDNANMEVKLARGVHNTLNDRLSESDNVSFKTNLNAFAGYKNQNFQCEIDKNVLGKIKNCVSGDIVLDIPSYLGVIEEAQQELTNALLNSGYSADGVLANYEWKEK